MSVFNDLLARIVALAMIGSRIAIFLAILPQCALTLLGESFGALLRQRFSSQACRWHRDLVLLSILSGMFGAGVGWNVTALTHGNLADARIIAALAMVVPYGLIVWLYRGTPRYRLDLPVTEG